jgi:hypothetical protein
VYFSIKTISLFASGRITKVNLGVFVFLSIYLFYPNNPEARLGPQELEIVFFLSALLFFISKLVLQKNGNIQQLSRVDYIAMLLSFAFLAGSKEPCIVLTFASLCFILMLNLTWKGFLRILPFVVVFVFSFLKIYTSSKAGGYGTTSLTYELIKSNFTWYSERLFLLDTSKVFIVLFICPIILYFQAKVRRLRINLKERPAVPHKRFCLLHIRDSIRNVLLYDKGFVFYVFVVLNFLAFFIVTLTFWAKVHRYFYPLVYILALLIGLSLTHDLQHYKGRRKFALVVVVITCAFYFISANYYNFVYQFASQYSVRTTEQNMLAEVTRLRNQNKTVYIYYPVWDEYEYEIANYFNSYLPFFCDVNIESNEIKVLQRITFFDENTYYVTKRKALPKEMVYKEFFDKNNLLLLKIAKTISSLALFDKSPSYYQDAGSPIIGGHNWYVYRNHLNLKADKDAIITLYRSKDRVEVTGGNPYAEYTVDLSKALEIDHLYIGKLRYYTTGNATPFFILIQMPYRPNNIPLHERLSLSTTPKTIEYPFSPTFNVPSPRILLRNWASEGAFVVENIELFEVVIDPNDISSE